MKRITFSLHWVEVVRRLLDRVIEQGEQFKLEGASIVFFLLIQYFLLHKKATCIRFSFYYVLL